MDFRDIRCINLAMLVKQGWRLFHGDRSLLYECFKTRYFPRNSFLEAIDVLNSSFVWKSLIAAQPILRKGCCWRVGDGSSIRVSHDRWIPYYPTNKILHPPLTEDQEWRVSDLIDWETHDWDRGFLAANFHREDVDAIARVPLSRRYVSEALMWLPNKKGKYSVKSGYNLRRIVEWERARGGLMKD